MRAAATPCRDNAPDAPTVAPTPDTSALHNVLAVANSAIVLSEPLLFNRPDPTDFSLVELAVLRGLGRSSFDFRPTHPRVAIVPGRFREGKRAASLRSGPRFADERSAVRRGG